MQSRAESHAVVAAVAAAIAAVAVGVGVGVGVAEDMWVSGCSVWSVPTRLRPLASGIAAIASHILGDVPTPPLVGLLQGTLAACWLKGLIELDTDECL